MKFAQWFDSAGVVVDELVGDAAINRATADSRDVRPGDCFVAMPSENTDTIEFLKPAAEAGATAAIVSCPEALAHARDLGLACAKIAPTGQRFNASLGRLCRTLLGDPTSKMRVIAVTGTNGKTTTAWMIRDALRKLGRRPAYLGTLGLHLPEQARELSNTTPFPVELWNLISEVQAAGATDLVMEASSHALSQRRLTGVSFDVGIFTNLSQDHLDFHTTMEAYADAKKLLFTECAMASLKPFVAAINESDPVGAQWSRELPCKVLKYGGDDSDFRFQIQSVSVDSIEAKTSAGATIQAGVGGLFNAANLTAAAAGFAAMGYDDASVALGLSAVTPVPGRFESIPNRLGIGIIVDYAHTPDALEKLLASARQLNPMRIITVFGCGGDRDRSKRPRMANVASRMSDVTVVTSDNPRTEDAQSIVEEVATGIEQGANCELVTDRRLAVHRAVTLANPGDLVVIAGKGHENYQIIGRTKHPMDDRELAKEALDAKAL